MTKTELARLACAVAVLRPDWPEPSLRTFLERHLHFRPLRDVAVALTFVATDPDTQSPARVLEPGPWWQHTRTGDVPRAANGCQEHPEATLRHDLATGTSTCSACWANRYGTDGQPQPLRRRGVPPEPDVRNRIRASLTPSRRETPSPTTARPGSEQAGVTA